MTMLLRLLVGPFLVENRSILHEVFVSGLLLDIWWWEDDEYICSPGKTVVLASKVIP